MRTGNQAMPPDTMNQLVRMIMDREPCMDDPHGILFMGDLYQYLLGAQACCEHSLVSYCRFYNNLFFDWDDEIMEALGIPQSIKTKIVYAGDMIGTVDPVILKEAGLEGRVDIITPCTRFPANIICQTQPCRLRLICSKRIFRVCGCFSSAGKHGGMRFPMRKL